MKTGENRAQCKGALLQHAHMEGNGLDTLETPPCSTNRRKDQETGREENNTN